jgi:hypothetical protein
MVVEAVLRIELIFFAELAGKPLITMEPNEQI